MDNLNSHDNAGVEASIFRFGHGLVDWAPYYPVDGAIAFAFNNIQTVLTVRMHEIEYIPTLILVLHQSIQCMIDFARYFELVGFIRI